MSKAIRVLHIGDVHLGVELYGRPDPERGYGSRVGDFLAALERALGYASGADLILFPGDIYKNCDPSPTLQREFALRIRRVARDVPVVIIPGNHDLPQAYGRASSVDIFHVLDVENVEVLRRPEVVSVPTARGEVLIAPLPFMPRSRLLTQEETKGKSIPEVVELMRTKLIDAVEQMAVEVTQLRQARGADLPAILMAHYTVQGAVFGGYGKGALLAPDVEMPLGVMKNDVFDYVALAHIHKHQSIPANDFTGQPPVVYPGSVERVDFGEEGEDKVVVLAEVARGASTWQAAPLHPRPFLTLRLKADDVDPLESVKAQIEEKRERFRGGVVRLQYELPGGHPNLPERELRAALEGAHYIAGIRRETPKQEPRVRQGALTTQLTPLEALEEYLRAQPQLAPLRDELVERAGPLVADVVKDPTAA
ncbi:MAG TPA: exonuclease SbcCD subunit D [Armatimonadota bacterium]|nr:exonuclease SbcCD subunit D [Armatimonadota bacterium]